MSEVLTYCSCEHPRHGHALRRRRSRSLDESEMLEYRAECTMTGRDGRRCSCLYFHELAPVPPQHGDGWRSITYAPHDARELEVWNGREVIRAHWASDLSGEEQPAFRGWFRDAGGYFTAVRPEPTHWRPIG